jgi:hypothetical protein
VYKNHTHISEDIAISMGRIDAEIIMSSTMSSSLETIRAAVLAIVEDDSDNEMTYLFFPLLLVLLPSWRRSSLYNMASKDLFSTTASRGNKDTTCNFATTYY